jgi:hypothetical protein
MPFFVHERFNLQLNGREELDSSELFCDVLFQNFIFEVLVVVMSLISKPSKSDISGFVNSLNVRLECTDSRKFYETCVKKGLKFRDLPENSGVRHPSILDDFLWLSQGIRKIYCEAQHIQYIGQYIA